MDQEDLTQEELQEIENFNQMKADQTFLRIVALRQVANVLRWMKEGIYEVLEANELGFYTPDEHELYEAHKEFINAMINEVMVISDELDQQADQLEQQRKTPPADHSEQNI
ncbi:hypothetical protein EI42_05752 [Thermosporothrix hazakensis]|jgi:hypothetical protein|uniref:Phage protein n=1 Tax=Thermosporothrix hazakensis TaxID=644383 RepID=A0A326TV86_THEHA|nr:hypothetical protein [Thermosporothrix hazakensis]PZW20991.1 hypothetical protein EI42_05752 [Thermosporothrix hazakensis]GCE49274.1 hypothetical protein KTH_41430 [Thermosporothrix hazakensis]